MHRNFGLCPTMRDFDELRAIIHQAITKGEPIWIAYNSNNSGYSTRYLFNLVYDWHGNRYDTPHIGLGHYNKYGNCSLSHFHAYCSNRKEFRMFAVDSRIEEIKVLNLDNVYILDEIYSHSLAHLIMNPYLNRNAFFENAESILSIMPYNEKETPFVQGNLANLLVMKGDFESAVKVYQSIPYNHLINRNISWGECCLADITFFISLCKEHQEDGHFYDGLDANVLLKNFKFILKNLKKSNWAKCK